MNTDTIKIGDTIQMVGAASATARAGDCDSCGDYEIDMHWILANELNKVYIVTGFDLGYLEVESLDGAPSSVAKWAVDHIIPQDNPEVPILPKGWAPPTLTDSERLFNVALDFGSAGNISMSQELMKLWNNEIKGEK